MEKVITFRADDDMHAMIKIRAAELRTTVSKYIVKLVKEEIAQNKTKKE